MDLLLNDQTDEPLHLDVCLDELSPQAGVIELLKTLRPQWRAEDIKLKVFTEGITNQLLGCSVSSDSSVVLVRVYGRMTELFVDRKKEMETLKLLHSYSCGPKLYCSFHNGICYEFLKGTALDDILLRQPSVYSSQLNIPSLDVLITEMEELKSHLNRVESPTVLCHNDLLTKNIIYNSDEGEVKFIDYEYADFNYQAYDIGNHFNEFAGVNNVDYSLYPTRDLQYDWLTVYLQSVQINNRVDSQITQREVNTLYVQVCKFSLASHLSWGLWALLQAKYSTINFDFLKYAAARFSYYFKKKEEYLGMPLP
ncbi:ethanolamine kinase 2 isoform X3 [Tachysurus vachellii]|uniref:ethanolamine kinase 2 isoform X3 n=1 Tax=Tachysurus vachellii TaxID=175792 RepID=UPI00296A9879|nr:ethanolamine kinase 2 isoform X3 [Tachysurus vachellii]